MGLIPDLKDFDHTIHDSRGIVGVKDGVEYPVSEEDWKKAHPEHRNTECKECIFVLDTSTILSFHVPKEVRDKANHEPKFIGKFTMPGWTGHSSFYLFKCIDCENVCVDYPHGYTSWGSCYLTCAKCGSGPILKKKEYYERDSIVVPLMALSFKERYNYFMKMFEDLDKLKPINMIDREENIQRRTLWQRIKSLLGLKP